MSAPPPPPPSPSSSKKPSNKRQKTSQKLSLFDNNRVRNCGGSDQSFLSTETTGLMDYTYDGSSTEEEDSTERDAYYFKKMSLDKMTKVTERPVGPVETCFGKGVNVWKSFSGSGRIYADVDDETKKKMQDERIWGKKKTEPNTGEKRKRGEKTAKEREEEVLNMGFSGQVPTLPLSEDEEDMMDYSMQVKLNTYNDSTIAYPNLPCIPEGSITTPNPPSLPDAPHIDAPLIAAPPSPTASEWDDFHVSMSQVEDIREPIPAPTTLPSRRNPTRPIKPLPVRAQDRAASFPGARSRDVPARNTGASSSSNGFRESAYGSGRDRRGAVYGATTSAGEDTSASSLSNRSKESTHGHGRDPHGAVTDASPSTSKDTTTTSSPSAGANAPYSMGTSRGIFDALGGGSRRILSDSFGGFGSTGSVDRFDERPYRLGQKGDSKGKGKEKEDNKDGDEKDNKPNPFKGRARP